MHLRLPRFLRPVAPTVKSGGGSACNSCVLSTCPTGMRATVLCLGCSGHDADRLRTLGLFEGARVTVVGRRSGILVDVLGSRLALGLALAASIIVRPADG